VVRIADFGAFVEIFPGTDGLLHISEISENRVREVRDELNEGDQILVKVLATEGNKIKLSRKAVLAEQRQKLGVKPAEDGEVAVAVERKAEPGDRPEGGGDRGGDRGDRPHRGDRGGDRGGRGRDRRR